MNLKTTQYRYRQTQHEKWINNKDLRSERGVIAQLNTAMRWVFNKDLKVTRLLVVRIFSGKEFQREGAATAKTRSPLFFSLDQGTSKTIWFADLRAFEGWYILVFPLGCRKASQMRHLLPSLLTRCEIKQLMLTDRFPVTRNTLYSSLRLVLKAVHKNKTCSFWNFLCQWISSGSSQDAQQQFLTHSLLPPSVRCKTTLLCDCGYSEQNEKGLNFCLSKNSGKY